MSITLLRTAYSYDEWDEKLDKALQWLSNKLSHIYR